MAYLDMEVTAERTGSDEAERGKGKAGAERRARLRKGKEKEIYIARNKKC